MLNKKTIGALCAAGLLALTSNNLHADPVRDCVLKGTVKPHPSQDKQVFVAFHSAKPAERGSNCRIRRNEKLHFSAPASALENASPGSRVEYRFTEDSNGETTWKLQKVSG